MLSCKLIYKWTSPIFRLSVKKETPKFNPLYVPLYPPRSSETAKATPKVKF